MFVLPEAAKARGKATAKGWAASLTMRAGQFCTKPGLVVIEVGESGDAFVAAAAEALKEVASQCMLTDGIVTAYRAGQARLAQHAGVRSVFATQSQGRHAGPNLFETDAVT